MHVIAFLSALLGTGPIIAQLGAGYGGYGGYSIGQIVLGAILVIGVLAILLTFCRARGITIPPEFVVYFWIVVGVVVAAAAVHIILNMA